jgi:preprotein translocase subunit SecG
VQPRVIFRDFAQHGNAWPTGDCRFIRSLSVANNSLPNSFEMVDLNGNVLQSFPDACVRYHGYTAVNGYELAGCGSLQEGAGHVMVLQYQAGTGRSTLIQMRYPHPNMRSGTLYGNQDMSYALGNYGNTPLGYNGIVRLTPSKGTIDNATDVLFFPREAWPATATGARSTCGMGLQQGGNDLFITALPDGYLYIYRSENFSITPMRVDLFPETRANLTRAMYSCTGPQAIRLEIGSRYAFVLRTVLDPNRLMRIDLDLGVADMFVTLPAGLPGTAIGDMHVTVPEAVSVPSCVAAFLAQSGSGTGSGNGGNTGASGSSSSDSDNRATIALAVLLGVAILALIVLGVAFFSHARKSQQLLHTKFNNPNGAAMSAL